MKKVFFFAALAVATVSMTSCDNNDEAFDNEPVEIRLSSTVAAQTRATFPDTDTKIISDRSVHVYVDDATTTTQLYGKNELTSDNFGGFTGGTPMYFPRNAVDIYAFHINGSLPSNFPTTAITHNVSADQRILNGYIASDLLYAATKNVARTSSAVNLTFYHLMSKIQVAVAAGSGFPSGLNIDRVDILGTLPNAQITPNKALAANAQTVTAAGTATAIEISNNVSANLSSAPAYNDAIIVPQTVSGAFIQITLSDGGKLTYSLPTSTIFESGKKYIYLITANRTGLTVTSTVSNWTAGGTTDGSAIMN